MTPARLLRRAGDQGGQRWALVGLGIGHAHLGHHELARGDARQALQLGSGGDTMNLASAHGLLGLVHSRLGEHRQAISSYRRALAIAHAWKAPLSRRMLAGLLANFGDACQATGDLAAGRQAWQQALQILGELGFAEQRQDPRPSEAGRTAQPAGLIVSARPGGFRAGAAGPMAVTPVQWQARGARSQLRAAAGPATRSSSIIMPGRAYAAHDVPVTCRDIASTPSAHRGLPW